MKSKNKYHFSLSLFRATALAILLCSWFVTFAEGDSKATIKLSFEQTDSTRTCKATALTDTGAIAGVEIHFYVQRSFHDLPINKAVETDEKGEAIMEFPLDLPGDKDGNIIAIAKIEDDDNFGNVEGRAAVKWGVFHKEKNEWDNRSLSASREKAPMYLIIASNLIIAVIWGTIIYVFLQIFKIKKSARVKQPVK